MCFIHVLLNALDLHSKGHEVKVIIEGSATKLIQERFTPHTKLYEKAKEQNILDCVCKACAAKTKSLEAAEKEGFTFCSEMSGHPSIGRYIENGFTVITF